LDEVEVLALVVVHGVVREGGLDFHGPVLNARGGNQTG
jgi:hypothetical protein